MDAPEKDIRRNCALVHRIQQMLRLGFDQGKGANLVKSFVLCRRVPPFLGIAGFCLAHLVHDKLPSAFGKFRIAVLQIHLRDLQIYGGLLAGFVEGV